MKKPSWNELKEIFKVSYMELVFLVTVNVNINILKTCFVKIKVLFIY